MCLPYINLPLFSLPSFSSSSLSPQGIPWQCVLVFALNPAKEKIRGKLTNFKFLIELYQQPHSIVVNSNDNE